MTTPQVTAPQSPMGTTRARRQSKASGQILRYRLGQRLVHALLATSFLLLLGTGLALVWSPLSPFAAGGTSRLLHRIGAIAFMAVPLVYLLVDFRGAKELLIESFTYDKDDLAWFRGAYRYFLGHAAGMPPQGRLNAGQKLHHAGVVIMSAVVVGSGLVLWFAKGNLGPTGLAAAAGTHDLAMLALTVLLAGHLYFTFVYKALSAMTTGYVSEEAARLEHAKWVEEVQHSDRS
jgi:formate dehydrogenase subunit gamma